MTQEPGRAAAPWVPRLVALDGVTGRVVVACSGGPDSLALLALAGAVGLDPVAVHVDHGLRPASAAEARVVARAAERLGVAARAVAVEVGEGPNLEARARHARYAALESVRTELDADWILVGHTRDDQAETVLLHLLRGSGTAGMAGIPPVRDVVRRPLLGLRRADTREICARLGLVPVDDPMNAELRHRRVWLRREVLPRLERGARRDVVEVLARQAELVRDDDALLEQLAAQAVPVRADGAIAVDALQDVPVALARRAVRRWLGIPPLDAKHVDAVLALARGARRAAQLPGDRRVERAGGALHLVPAHEMVPDPVALALPGTARFGSWSVESWVEEAPPVAWPDGRSAAVCDADRVGGQATVRAARAGDRFRPAGASGSKLVHDALAEAGVPAGTRPRRPVLTGPDDEVWWVVGYRVDDRVRVTSRTRRYLWVTTETGSAA